MKHFYKMFLALCVIGWQATYAAETEPNNTTAQANTLSLNGSNTGKISPAGDVDWWKITTTADGKLSLKLTPATLKKVWLYVYDNNGTTVLQSANSNVAFTQLADGLAAGTYFLKVVAVSATDTLSYTLADTFTAATPANDAEPDNEKSTALTLPQNGTATGHVGYYYKLQRDTADWYKLTTTADSKLKLKVTPANGQALAVTIYANNGTSFINSGSGSSAFTLTTDGLKKDVYYVKVNANSAAGFSAYTLTDSTSKPATDSFILAVNFAYKNKISKPGGTNWWKITTAKDGKLTFTLSPVSGKYVWIYLYDHDRTTLLNSSYSNTKFVQATDGLAAGTYYAKVVPYYATDTSTYVLADTLTTPSQANDAEPNDTRAQAVTLSVNGSKTGHIGYLYNNKRDTADWYKITTTSDGALKLNLTPANGTYTYVYLYDNDGTTLLNTSYSNAAFSYTTDGLAAGTYYVRVNCYYTNGFAPYTLSNTLIKPAPANDTEPNNTKALARTFTQNTTVTGHVGYYYNNKRDSSDWYKITTTSDGLLKFDLTPANGQYLWVYLYDNDGTTLLNSTYSNAAFSMSTDGLAAGTYYVRVNCYYNTGFTPYTLKNTLTTYSYTTDAEPNNRAFQATPMPANSTVTGHVNFYYKNTRDAQDWWKLAYTGTGHLNFTFNLAPRKIDNGIPYVWFYVYKDTAASPIYGSYFNTASNTISLTSVAKGSYYIKVIPYYATDFVAYSIANSSAATLTSTTNISAAVEDVVRDPGTMQIRVYPNPASTQVHVAAVKGINVVMLVLKDVNGKTVWSAVNTAFAVQGSTTDVDVSKLPGGTYFLILTDKSGKTITQKVIVAH